MKQDQKSRETRYKYYLKAEREAVALYTAMADADGDPRRERVFRDLVESEQRHVAFWAGKLGFTVEQLPTYRRGFRVRVMGWLAHSFGTQRVLPLVLRIEGDDTRMYGGDPEAVEVMEEGEEHTEKLRGLKVGSYPGGDLDSGGWQRAAAGGAFRAGVLGGNDGLVSNFGLVWGVAGGTSDTQIVMLAGVAGLVAGAFSMAAGEYVSMRADRDLAEHRIEKERQELLEVPEEEKEELALIYQLKGLSQEEADALAERLMQNKDVALETMIREELGLDPSQLGSPWGSAISSFLTFSTGAALPVLPYVLGMKGSPFIVSGALSLGALFLVGAVLAFLSNKGPLRGGLRMLIIGAAAAAVTNGIGRLVGISLS